MTSDDCFHARDLPCSHVKSCDDPISDCPRKGKPPERWFFVECLHSYTSFIILVLNAWTIISMINVSFRLQYGWLFPSFADILFACLMSVLYT